MHEREQVIDFSIPFATTSSRLYQLTSMSVTSQLNVTAFVNVFRLEVWMTILALAFLICSLLKAVDTILNRSSMALRPPYSTLQLFLESWLPELSSAQKTGLPQKSWARILSLTTTLLILVLAISYSSDLTAYLTAHPADTIETCQDIIDGGYTLLMNKGGALESRLLHESGPLHNCAHLMEFNSATCDIACAATSLEEKHRTLYISPDSILDRRLMAKDSFVEHFTHYLGLCFQKDSEFRELFSHHVIKMIQGGITDKLIFQWFGSDLVTQDEPVLVSANPISLDQLLFPTLCLLGGMIIAVGITKVEYLVPKFRSWKMKQLCLDRDINILTS